MEWYVVFFRLLIAVIAGGVIGSERARHGRSAGLRTHILVCLGAALVSATAMFVSLDVGLEGDVFRMPAQVISGIGFLGAGIIILRKDKSIMGLTTAAGVWNTAIIGMAIGFGYYLGAGIATALLLLAIILLTRFEKSKLVTHLDLYVQIEEIKKLNEVLEGVAGIVPQEDYAYKVVEAVGNGQNQIGLQLHIINPKADYFEKIKSLEYVLFVAEELVG